MAFFQNLYFQAHCATHGSVEVLQLEPQQNAVAVWSKSWISKRTMFVFHIPTMQLKNELLAGDKPLVFVTAMSTGAAK